MSLNSGTTDSLDALLCPRVFDYWFEHSITSANLSAADLGPASLPACGKAWPAASTVPRHCCTGSSRASHVRCKELSGRRKHRARALPDVGPPHQTSFLGLPATRCCAARPQNTGRPNQKWRDPDIALGWVSFRLTEQRVGIEPWLDGTRTRAPGRLNLAERAAIATARGQEGTAKSCEYMLTHTVGRWTWWT